MPRVVNLGLVEPGLGAFKFRLAELSEDTEELVEAP